MYKIIPYMKTLFSILATASVMISIAWISPESSVASASQEEFKAAPSFNPSFSFFRVHRQGKNGAVTNWGLSSNAGVSGFFVEKTYEDPSDPYAFWETVSSLPCNGERSYKCTDNNVLPGFITYRITAQLNTGGTMVSEIRTLHIVSH
jgi:hypothetical protein